MNLISWTHNFYERRKYTFNILREYSIITHPFLAFYNFVSMIFFFLKKRKCMETDFFTNFQVFMGKVSPPIEIFSFPLIFN